MIDELSGPKLISLLTTHASSLRPKQSSIFRWWASRCTNTYDDDDELAFIIDPDCRCNSYEAGQWTRLISDDCISLSTGNPAPYRLQRTSSLIYNARRLPIRIYQSFGNRNRKSTVLTIQIYFWTSLRNNLAELFFHTLISSVLIPLEEL